MSEQYKTSFYWRKDNEKVERSTRLDREIMLKKEKKDEELDTQFQINSFSLNSHVMKDKTWKDTQNEKLSDRQRIIQTNVNPFLKQNYIEDLDKQKEFLMPKDSNFNE